MEDYVDTYSGSDLDDQEQEALVSNVLNMRAKSRLTKPTRTEPTVHMSEFHLVKSGTGSKGTLKLSDLTRSLTTRASHKQLSKRLARADQVAKTLPRPLEKPQANRIRRSVAYDNTKEQLGRWDAVVTSNRAASTLRFPLPTENKKPVTEKYIIKSEMQKALEELNKKDKVEVYTPKLDEDDPFPLSMEEMVERRKEMAKLRAVQSYKEAKARRQNKIKSKKYHRLERRQMVKQQLKDFELLQKTNPEAALEKLEDIERARAQERVSLRHKSTGQWAKSKQIRAKYDKESRQVLAEQLAISRDLTQKTKANDDSDDDVNDSANVNPVVTDSSNPWTSNKLIKPDAEVTSFVSSYRQYWSEQNAANANGATKPHAENDEFDSFVEDETKTGAKLSVPATNVDDKGWTTDDAKSKQSPSKLINSTNKYKKDKIEDWTQADIDSVVKGKRDNEAFKSFEETHVPNDNLTFENFSYEDSEVEFRAGRTKRSHTSKLETCPEDIAEIEAIDNKETSRKKRKRSRSKKKASELVESKEDTESNVQTTDPNAKSTKKRAKLSCSPHYEKNSDSIWFVTENSSKIVIPNLTVNVDNNRNDSEEVAKSKTDEPKLSNRAKKKLHSENKKGKNVIKDLDAIDVNVQKKLDRLKKSIDDKKENADEQKPVKTKKPSSSEKSGHEIDKPKKKKKAKNNYNVDEVFNFISDSVQKKVSKKLDSLKKAIETEENRELKKRAKDFRQKSAKTKKPSTLDELKMAPKRKRAATDGLIDDSDEDDANVQRLEELIKSKKSADKNQTSEIDPNEIIKLKPVQLNSALPDMIIADDEANDNHDSNNQRGAIAEAFQDDDIVAEFEQDKRQDIERDKGEDVDLTLPGWGEWGGANLKPSKRKRKRFMVKAAPSAPRRDENKGHLIVDDKGNRGAALEHMVSDVPFPYRDARDFETSLQTPMDPQFVPMLAHRKFVEPAVITSAGEIIAPMTDEVLVKKKPEPRSRRR